MTAKERAAIQQAIADICAARLCEVNSMSSRQEMLRLMIQATDTLRAALEQPEPGGVCARCGGWVCDPVIAKPEQVNYPEEKLQTVAEYVGDKCAVWYGIGARDVEEVLRQSARLGLVTLNFDTGEQPEQEPVAFLLEYKNGERELRFKNNGWPAKETPLYTHPPRREWRGLTEEEREQATGWSVEHIEAALKEKNHE